MIFVEKYNKNMTLADKIQLSRKKKGMSQEDLANLLDVSRQAVQKWESGASVPELDKLVAMSNIFEVSLDFLIKDIPDANKTVSSNNVTMVMDFSELRNVKKKEIKNNLKQFLKEKYNPKDKRDAKIKADSFIKQISISTSEEKMNALISQFDDCLAKYSIDSDYYKKRKKKILKLGMISFIILALIGAGVGAGFGIARIVSYNKAKTMMESGDYNNALNKYLELGDDDKANVCYGLLDLQSSKNSGKETTIISGINKIVKGGEQVDVSYYSKEKTTKKYLNANTEYTETISTQISSLYSPSNNKGYSFISWSTDSFNYKDNHTYLNLKSNWELLSYKIVYELYGGTNDSRNPSGYNVETSDITLYSPSRIGYVFAGWFESQDYTGLPIETIDTEGCKDLTLHAKWEPIIYYINYSLNGGINDSRNVTSYTIEDNVYLYEPTKTGYSFAGWYEGSTKIECGEWHYLEDKNLSAHWTARQYNITLISDGTSSPAQVTYDSNYNFGKVNKTGYTFVGWYTGQNGTGTKLTDNNGNSLNVWSYTNVTNVYAYFTKNSYLLTYLPNGGTIVGTTTQEVVFDEQFAVKTVTRDGYTFLGWFNGDEQIVSGTWNYPNNVTVTAKWKAKTYKINLSEISSECHYYLILNNNNGTANTKVEVSRDTPISYPTPPTKTKHLFMGWYSDSACTSLFDFSQNINQDTNIYAGWRSFSNWGNPIFDDLSGKTYSMQSTYDDSIGFFVAAYQNTTYRLNYTFYSTGARTAYIYFYDIDDGQSSHTAVAHSSSSGSYTASVQAGHVYRFGVSPDTWYSDKKISCSLSGSYPTPTTIVGDNPNLQLSFEYDKSYSLGVPDARIGQTFVGWYTEPNGEGTKLTDENGNSLTVWNYLTTINAYPYFE